MQSRVYFGFDRPDVLVRVGGEWFPGELRSWVQDEAGAWSAGVQWTKSPGLRFLDRFAVEDVQEDDGRRGVGTGDERRVAEDLHDG